MAKVEEFDKLSKNNRKMQVERVDCNLYRFFKESVAEKLSHLSGSTILFEYFGDSKLVISKKIKNS